MTPDHSWAGTYHSRALIHRAVFPPPLPMREVSALCVTQQLLFKNPMKRNNVPYAGREHGWLLQLAMQRAVSRPLLESQQFVANNARVVRQLRRCKGSFCSGLNVSTKGRD